MRASPAAVSRVAYQRVATDAAGAAVRALLGAGGASVIPWLSLQAGAAALPPRPFVAYKPGVVAEVTGVDQHGGEWWIYDDPGQGTWRIDQVADALAAAFDPRRGAARLPWPAGGARVDPLSEPRVDRALGGLIVRRLPLILDA